VRASAKKPKASLRMVQANAYPPVQLCSVCETLMVGLRAPEHRVEEPVAAPEAVKEPVEQAPKPVEKAAEAEVVAVPVVAAVAETEGVSPAVAEIMNKIGPATKEAPKTRGLHEHRATEEWDEVVAKQAKQK